MKVYENLLANTQAWKYERKVWKKHALAVIFGWTKLVVHLRIKERENKEARLMCSSSSGQTSHVILKEHISKACYELKVSA